MKGLFGILILMGSGLVSQAVIFPAYDTKVITWIKNSNLKEIENADGTSGTFGQISCSTALAASIWMRDVRNAGLYPGKILRANLFAGNQFRVSGSPSFFRLGSVAVPIIDDVGTKGGDTALGSSTQDFTYQETGSLGGLKDSTGTGALNTGFNSSTGFVDTNNAGMMVYVGSTNLSDDGYLMGAQDTTSKEIYLRIGSSLAVGTQAALFNDTAAALSTETNGIGYFAASRTNSSTVVLYKTNAVLVSSGSAGGTLPTTSIGIFCLNIGFASSTTKRILEGYEINTGYTAAQVAADFSAWQGFQIALNREKYPVVVPPVTTNQLVFTNLTNFGNTSNATKYVTASVTPTTNSLKLLLVQNTKASAPDLPSGVTSTNLQWWLVGTTNFNTLASPTARLSLYASQDDPNTPPVAGPISVWFPATQTGLNLHLLEVSGAKKTQAWGRAALQQVAFNGSNTVANMKISWTSPSSNTNGWLVAFGDNINSTTDNTNEAGWTTNAETSYTTPAAGLASYYLVGTPPSVTFTTNGASSRSWGALAVEVIPGISTDTVNSDKTFYANAYIDMNVTNAVGSLITTTNLTNGTQLASSVSWFNGWTETTSPALAFAVGTNQIARRNPVKVGTYQYGFTTFATNSTSLALNYTNLITPSMSEEFQLQAQKRQISFGAYVFLGPTNGGNSDFELLEIIGAATGDFIVYQLWNGQSINSYQMTLEASNGGTHHSAFFDVTPNHWYWVTGDANFNTGLGHMSVYDTNGWTHVSGSPVSISMVSGDYPDRVRIGNYAGGNAGLTPPTIFQQILLDTSDGVYPMIP